MAGLLLIFNLLFIRLGKKIVFTGELAYFIENQEIPFSGGKSNADLR